MYTCDIQGFFHPAMVLLSAGDKDNEQRGEPNDFSSTPWRISQRRPITGVCDRSNVKSIVLPIDGNKIIEVHQ